MDKGKKRTLIRDVCLISAFIVLGLALLLATRAFSSQGAFVVVQVDGLETGTYSLSEDGVYSLNGGSNVLEVKDGRARLIEANCPNHLCIRQGWVSRRGQSIVCLPNRLTVTVMGGDGSYDLVM